jgi:hypothetical protein
MMPTRVSRTFARSSRADRLDLLRLRAGEPVKEGAEVVGGREASVGPASRARVTAWPWPR